MDRYVIREPRSGGEFPEGNQMIAFSATNSRTGNNITIQNLCPFKVNNLLLRSLDSVPENSMYYGSYGGEVRVQNANMQQLGTHMLVTPHGQNYSPNEIQAQGQIVSGIDPIYISAYADNNTAYAQTMHGGNNISSPVELNNNINFGSDYQNRNFTGAESSNRNFSKTQVKNYNYDRMDANENDRVDRNVIRNQIHTVNNNRAQATNPNFIGSIAYNHNSNKVEMNDRNFNGSHANNSFNRAQTFQHQQNNQNFNRGQENDGNFNVADTNNNFNRAQTNNQKFKGEQGKNCNFKAAETNNLHYKGAERVENKLYVPQTPNVASKKQTEVDLLKQELQNQVKSQADKLKDLYKSGTRVFSGPVEKIVKWHKSIQDIGVMVFYEIVGKCVNVRAGESCAKNLVVRDENGPAIQVVYYEIDFFLPELKPPCTVRVIGRMMPGTNRFQAFNVRPATGDDVATLPRRAAVAAHHVAKLCKEYGVEVLTLK